MLINDWVIENKQLKTDKNVQIHASWQLYSKPTLKCRSSSHIHTKNSQPLKAKATLMLNFPPQVFLRDSQNY